MNQGRDKNSKRAVLNEVKIIDEQLKLLYKLFSNEPDARVKEAIFSIIFPRVAFFDPIEKLPKEAKREEVLVRAKYGGFDIVVKRKPLTNLHERLFYGIFALGIRNLHSIKTDREVVEQFIREGYWNGEVRDHICFIDFYELKKYVNIPVNKSWKEIEPYFHDLASIHLNFEKKETGRTLFGIHTRLLNSFTYAIDETHKKKIWIGVEFNEFVIRHLNLSSVFLIDKEVLKEINKKFAKYPYIYRTVMFFLTQTTPSRFDLFEFVKLIDRNVEKVIESKKKRHLIRKEFIENQESLKKYGITLQEENGKLYLVYTGKLDVSRSILLMKPQGRKK